MALLTVRMPDDEYERAKARAAVAGLSLSEYTRQRVAGPDRLPRITQNGGGAAHAHVAGKATPSGVHSCTVPNCNARKVGGRWVDV